jgi:fructose-bisphosphate aldolase class II
MKTLHELLIENEGKGIAIGHFNMGDLSSLKAIVGAARKLGLPVIVGVSEGERDYVGLRNAVSLVRGFRDEYHLPIFLNADHTHSFEKIKQAVAAGFDSVLFDGGKLPWAENIRETKRVVDYVRRASPGTIVEGELGYIGSSSEIRDSIPDGAAIKPSEFTSPEEAKKFVTLTGIDMLAPSVGNIHGMFENAPEPELDIRRIDLIKKAVKVPLVLHGASGNTDKNIRDAIRAGIGIVHFSTELRVAWRKGLEEELKRNPKEVAPHRLLAPAEEEMRQVVLNKFKLFQA